MEPLRSYFEQLPVADGKLLLNVAISNHDGFEDLYFVRPQLVEAHLGSENLLAWLDERSIFHQATA